MSLINTPATHLYSSYQASNSELVLFYTYPKFFGSYTCPDFEPLLFYFPVSILLLVLISYCFLGIKHSVKNFICIIKNILILNNFVQKSPHQNQT